MLAGDKQQQPLRWGILSAGKISYDFCVGLSTLPSTDHQVVHVGARNTDKSKQFAASFNIPRWSGDYATVVDDPDVDVVYVGAINTKHKELCLLCLEHGKAMLCEKPATMNGKELDEVLAKAEEKNTFYMEVLIHFFILFKSLYLFISLHYREMTWYTNSPELQAFEKCFWDLV